MLANRFDSFKKSAMKVIVISVLLFSVFSILQL